MVKPTLKEDSSHPRILRGAVVHWGMNEVLKSPRLLVPPYHKKLTLVCACSFGTRRQRHTVFVDFKANGFPFGVSRQCGSREATLFRLRCTPAQGARCVP